MNDEPSNLRAIERKTLEGDPDYDEVEITQFGAFGDGSRCRGCVKWSCHSSIEKAGGEIPG
jgi:hypothetical protein